MEYSFSNYVFNIPKFIAVVSRVMRWANGRVKRKKSGEADRESTRRTTGCVDPAFIQKHNLTTSSQPEDYINILLPLKKNIHQGKEYISFQQLKQWTNIKASLAGAGKDGVCYPDFKDFTEKEIQQHIGLYVFQGLCPSPRIELKFNPQHRDKIHGNDFVYRSFGANAERRHRHFKAFFSCQDPRKDPPPRDQHPNWKVRPLLAWMNFIFPVIWLLAVAFSVDEMTMGFKGQHKDKKE